jgi:hypothetical protein
MRHSPFQALALALLFAPTTTAFADEFRLEAASVPAPFLNNGKTDTVIEASGVEPIGDGRTFLVAHDKLPALHVVDAATGRLLGAPITSARFPEPSMIGPKWEGMALDSDGNYYLIGAHVGKTDEERTAKSYLFRFRLKTGTPAPEIDDASVVRWNIARSLENVMRAEGLSPEQVGKRKIEGLAIRARTVDGTNRRDLVIGLRDPGDRVRTYAADITANPSPDAELELKPLFSFEAEPREGVPSQLTSLEYVSALGGFLVVTATEDADNVFHGNTLWFVPDGSTGQAQKIHVFGVAMKAEGLAVLGATTEPGKTSVKLLITYDNDPHATKIPSRFQTATLVHETR